MIAIVADSLQRARFFLRLVKPLSEQKDFVFLTTEPLAHRSFRRAGYRSVYLRRRSGLETSALRAGEGDTRESIEYLNGDLDSGDLSLDYCSIYIGMMEVLSTRTIERCAIWNGQQLLGRAATRVCRELGIPTIYLEISNLPNKLFSDPDGVNALSSISRNPGMLDQLPQPDAEAHRIWLTEYEAYKESPPPQAKVERQAKLASGANYILKYLSNGVLRRKLNALQVRNSAVGSIETVPIAVEQLRDTSYVFLPLQVSGDTQLKLHSRVGNLEAIRRASIVAKERGCTLLVKPHPAETNAAELRSIAALQTELDFKLVAGNTTALIRNAASVITINSTVGLEALLYGKPVVCLGSSYYREFDQDRVRKFVHGYLVDGIDYFSNTPITLGAAARTLRIQE